LFVKLKPSKRTVSTVDERVSDADLKRVRTGSMASNGSSFATGPPALGGNGSFWEFEVEDNGVGMTPDIQSKIFEPFMQADQALTRKFGGTGLGLSICRQLAHALNGSISVSSELGVGSTFTLRVPLRLGRKRPGSHPVSTGEFSVATVSGIPRRSSLPKDVHDIPEPANPKSLFAVMPGLRILIAEDNIVNQEVMKRMLLLESVLHVECANNGKQAVEKVGEAIKAGYHYDIIFVDLQMPVMNGMEAVRIMRTTLAYTYPIVALTAFADEATAKQCREAAMDDILVKPVLRERLQAILAKHCTKNDVATAANKISDLASN
jgi:osomolarity two-component system sensor histidine kinase SLN1